MLYQHNPKITSEIENVLAKINKLVWKRGLQHDAKRNKLLKSYSPNPENNAQEASNYPFFRPSNSFIEVKSQNQTTFEITLANGMKFLLIDVNEVLDEELATELEAYSSSSFDDSDNESNYKPFTKKKIHSRIFNLELILVEVLNDQYSNLNF